MNLPKLPSRTYSTPPRPTPEALPKGGRSKSTRVSLCCDEVLEMLSGNARSEFFELKSEGRAELPLGEGGEYS